MGTIFRSHVKAYRHPVFFLGKDVALGERLCRTYLSIDWDPAYRLDPDVQMCSRDAWDHILPRSGPALIFLEMMPGDAGEESRLVEAVRAHNANLQVVLLVDSSTDYFLVARNCALGNILKKDQFDASILGALTIRLLTGNIFGFEPYFPNGYAFGPIFKTFHGGVVLDRLITTCFEYFIPHVPKEHASVFKCFIHELLVNTVAYAIGGITPEDRDKNLTSAPSEVFIPERRAIKVSLVGDHEKNAISVQDSSGQLSMLRVLEKLRRHTCVGEETMPPGMWDGSGRGMSLIQKDSRFVVNILKGVRTETIFMHYLKEELNRYESVIMTEVSPFRPW